VDISEVGEDGICMAEEVKMHEIHNATPGPFKVRHAQFSDRAGHDSGGLMLPYAITSSFHISTEHLPQPLASESTQSASISKVGRRNIH
jgi:hypothetical protein